jgi:hypothetical protein
MITKTLLEKELYKKYKPYINSQKNIGAEILNSFRMDLKRVKKQKL